MRITLVGLAMVVGIAVLLIVLLRAAPPQP